MKIKSLIKTPQGLQKIDVEVILLPGLPQIHFIGQADAQIKESSFRIKSAIKLSGFQFPTSQQVLVNLSPHSIKKSSLGLEFAVVYGILIETQQIASVAPSEDLVVYAELGLNGDVFEPIDLLTHIEVSESVQILTGVPLEARKNSYSFSRKSISHLSKINQAQSFPVEKSSFELHRPECFLEKSFSLEEEKLIKLLAIGQHSLFLAGPAGSGKSTLAQGMVSFLPAPKIEFERDYQWRKNIIEAKWRPSLMPHHSATPKSLIGGGDPIFVGEITKAHGGVLILDEYLEFHPQVQESLRGPLQEKKIRISRGRSAQEFPCDALVIATTNLCPCGKWSPGRMVQCFHSLKRCRSVLERLSGPVLDRFEILFYKESRGKETRLGFDILKDLEEVWRRQEKCKQLEIKSSTREHFQFYFNDDTWSERRKKACFKVAHSFAWLEGETELRPKHIEQAFDQTCRSFLKLQKGIG